MRKMIVNDFTISDDSDCYVIAEIGNNHQGDLQKAKEMFHAAKECGVDAVKLQKRDNKSLLTKAAYDKPYDNENSFGATYGEHREALDVERFRSFGLHAERQLVGRDACLEHRIVVTARGVFGVELAQQVELRPLELGRDVAALEVTDRRRLRGNAGVADRRALIDAG